MTSTRTYWFVAASVGLTGILAGASLDRIVVQLPAFRQVGLQAWAAFSQRADLGNGLFWYPALGVGSTILCILSAIVFRRDKAAPSSAALPIYGAVVAAGLGLLATTQAAPYMLRLREIHPDDLPRLQEGFDGFVRWHLVRAFLQLLAFVLSVRSLQVLHSSGAARVE
jgi:hypothetical protein